MLTITSHVAPVQRCIRICDRDRPACTQGTVVCDRGCSICTVLEYDRIVCMFIQCYPRTALHCCGRVIVYESVAGGLLVHL